MRTVIIVLALAVVGGGVWYFLIRKPDAESAPLPALPGGAAPRPAAAPAPSHPGTRVASRPGTRVASDTGTATITPSYAYVKPPAKTK